MARDLERERRSLFLVAGNPDLSSHLPDELAADVEAETGAPDPAPHLRIETRELLEDPLSVGLGNPHPLVLDGEARRAVERLGANLDPAAAGRILDRVVDEIREHAAQLLRVDRDLRYVRALLEHDLNPLRRELGGRRDDLGDDRNRVAGLLRLPDLPRVEAAGPEHVVDQLRQARALAADDADQPLPGGLVELTLLQRDRAPVDGG